MQQIDPFTCAVFLMSAFVLAGFVQVAWFATAMSQNFAVPLDRGRTVGGRPIFGAHKTLRGFVVMVPAAALAFSIVARVAGAGDAQSGLWPLTSLQYAMLGAWAGLGFMAGELPNSFVKRVAAGEGPALQAVPLDRLMAAYFAVVRKMNVDQMTQGFSPAMDGRGRLGRTATSVRRRCGRSTASSTTSSTRSEASSR